LEEVAAAAGEKLRGAPESLRRATVLAGLLHDVGKATPWFQDRIRGLTDRKPPESRHSELSAVIAWKVSENLWHLDNELGFRLFLFVSILRHHGDLQYSWVDELITVKNGDHCILERQLRQMDLAGLSTWVWETLERMGFEPNKKTLTHESVLESIRNARLLRLRKKLNGLPEALHFFQVFGSLLGADKTASAGKEVRLRCTIPSSAVREYLCRKNRRDGRPASASKQMVLLRRKLHDEVAQAVPVEGEKLFTLTAPTGSGKTLTVLNVALKIRKQLRDTEGVEPAIIYCLPFTSIIDQNHKVFKDVLATAVKDGLDSRRLLKHHHLTDLRYRVKGEGEFEADDSALFVESWHAEIVVTTFHQFLYTIFTNRNRNLKRFHRLRDAIVILDEVQAIPRKYWDPIGRVLEAMARELSTTFILMTATKPLIFRKGMARELVLHPDSYFQRLDRFDLENRIGERVTLEQFATRLASELPEDASQMTIVNTRRAAVELFRILRSHLPHREIFCLSLNLTPRDRRKRIQRIQQQLTEGIQCLLVTTQLVEAGVDLSFDRVDRDIAPLDSIIQAAGRCNRHATGKRGKVVVWEFVSEDKNLPFAPFVYRDPTLLSVTKEVVSGKSHYREPDLFNLGQEYFQRMWERTDEIPVDKILAKGEYQEIEEKFKLINEKWFEQSYFIIQDSEDQKIWDWFISLGEIADPIARKQAYLQEKRAFMERIIQVPVKEDERPDRRVLPMEAGKGVYSKEIGFDQESIGASTQFF